MPLTAVNRALRSRFQNYGFPEEVEKIVLLFSRVKETRVKMESTTMKIGIGDSSLKALH
ncbi:hypothetical protein T10_11360 [Trichinella papuae]|uniref:Uncharacterized protein n=1 Tax=Trichinella papuae TaxID=268474 RepID=A0A0V1MW05_9BILA|nr:hypothetical protein T10_11360 [Trichinella papuae]